MAQFDLLNPGVRKQIIDDIEGDENAKRKQESYRRFEIYKERSEPYLRDILNEQLDEETVRDYRVISSINLTKRIINEMSCVYRHAPTRFFGDVSDELQERLETIYDVTKVDRALKTSNRYLNLQEQCTIYTVPSDGLLQNRVLQPHQFDVVPDPFDPLKPSIYIISVFDRNQFNNKVEASMPEGPTTSGVQRRVSDKVNQTIGDQDDWHDTRPFYVWWSKEYHLLTNKAGRVIDPKTMQFMDTLTEEDIKSPIPGVLPFTDVAQDRESEYWNRYGNNTVQFSLDFSLLLSDICEINKLQGYAQPVFASVELPRIKKIGPNRVLWLKKDPNAEKEAQPEFNFATPNPDLMASLELLKTKVSLFLTSQGQSPKTISGNGETESFASGLERLLAMIEKFEASQDDIDIFKDVEKNLFKVIKTWLGVFNGVIDEPLDSEIAGSIPDDVNVSVTFQKPDMIQTKDDRENSVIKLLKAGVIDEIEAIMELYDLSEEEAKDKWQKMEDRKKHRESDVMGRLLDNANRKASADREASKAEGES